MMRNYSIRRQPRRLIAVLIIVFAIVFSSTLHFDHKFRTRVITVQPGLYHVEHFVDGDTIEVNMNGHLEKIRFIGVDTPETHKPNTPVQCYGPQAAKHTKAVIGQQPIRLVADPLNTDRDRYGRLLRYVYLPSGQLINRLLIEQGYGFYYPYFPFSKQHSFERASSAAQASKQGLWNSCQPIRTDSGGWLSNVEGT